MDVVFYADVNLAIADLKPKTAPALEAVGFGDLRQPKKRTIEFTSRLFHSWRNRQLHVMNGCYHVLVKLQLRA